MKRIGNRDIYGGAWKSKPRPPRRGRAAGVGETIMKRDGQKSETITRKMRRREKRGRNEPNGGRRWGEGCSRDCLTGEKRPSERCDGVLGGERRKREAREKGWGNCGERKRVEAIAVSV